MRKSTDEKPRDYLIKDFPAPLKERGQIYAVKNRTTLKAVMLAALERFLKNGGNPE